MYWWGRLLPVWDTFQKKMLLRYILASPLVVFLRATERAHQQA
ncbi:TPA: DNA invertase, partial [Escherichia coli]|nr:DNA invertase [Escherichia coli]